MNLFYSSAGFPGIKTTVISKLFRQLFDHTAFRFHEFGLVKTMTFIYLRNTKTPQKSRSYDLVINRQLKSMFELKLDRTQTCIYLKTPLIRVK